MSKIVGNTAKTGGVAILVGVTALIVAVVLAAMWVFGWGWFSRATADFRGETNVTEQIHADGDYRITAYDKFFDLCAAVQSSESSIANLEAELETDPSDDRVEQLNASITAQRNNRSELITQYNADASKADTRANFLASDLPYQLDEDNEETQCAA